MPSGGRGCRRRSRPAARRSLSRRCRRSYSTPAALPRAGVEGTRLAPSNRSRTRMFHQARRSAPARVWSSRPISRPPARLGGGAAPGRAEIGDRLLSPRRRAQRGRYPPLPAPPPARPRTPRPHSALRRRYPPPARRSRQVEGQRPHALVGVVSANRRSPARVGQPIDELISPTRGSRSSRSGPGLHRRR